jgi:hypothetical protein
MEGICGDISKLFLRTRSREILRYEIIFFNPLKYTRNKQDLRLLLAKEKLGFGLTTLAEY